MNKQILVLVALPTGLATAAAAEDTKESAFTQLADYAKVDLSLPASPAFAVLGL
jgi:hypothetical protein